jgi:hypothetical protein
VAIDALGEKSGASLRQPSGNDNSPRLHPASTQSRQEGQTTALNLCRNGISDFSPGAETVSLIFLLTQKNIFGFCADFAI